MHTIQLKISDSKFEATKAYLQKEFTEIVAENAIFYSQEGFEAKLDKVISKYEESSLNKYNPTG